MQDKMKAGISIVLLVIGMFLLLEGSRITTSGRPEWMDLAFIVVGGVFVVAYLPLMGNYLELKLKTTGTVTIMPIILTLGAVLVYQGVARPLGVVEKALFAGLGIALVVVSLFMIFRAKKKR